MLSSMGNKEQHTHCCSCSDLNIISLLVNPSAGNASFVYIASLNHFVGTSPGLHNSDISAIVVTYYIHQWTAKQNETDEGDCIVSKISD